MGLRPLPRVWEKRGRGQPGLPGSGGQPIKTKTKRVRQQGLPPPSFFFLPVFYSTLRVFVWHVTQGTERLAKANRLQRDFEREVMNPKYICPMFTLPDGKIIGKATDKEEYTAQLEDQLKRTAKQKRDVAAQCREEERCLCVLLGACIIALLTCPYMYIYIYIY